MDRETIIKLAREVYGKNPKWEGAALERLERFAKLVAEHERQAIAQMVKPLDESLADEILARSQK
jgi:hypothetical protein